MFYKFLSSIGGVKIFSIFNWRDINT